MPDSRTVAGLRMTVAGLRMAIAGLLMALPSGAGLAVLAGVVTLATLVGVQHSGGERVVEIALDMKVSRGTRLHLYVNDETKPPFQATLEEGTRHIYKFAGAYSRITRIRLDPTDAKGASVEICGISVTDGRGPAHELGPVSRSTWGAIDAIDAQASTGCTGFTSTSASPIIYKDESLVLESSRWPAIADSLKKLRTAQDTWPLLLMVAFGVIAGSGLRSWRWATLVGLACASTLVFAVTMTTRYDLRLLSPSQAVSFATYFGRPAMGNRLAVQSALVLSVATALWVAAISRRMRKGSAEPEPGDHLGPGSAGKRFPRVAFVSVLAVLGLVLMPELRASLRAASAGVFPLNWDMENLVLWQSLAHRGLLPLRDYWFPYGGTYLFDQPAPWGDLIAWMYQLLMYGGFFSAVVILTRGRIAISALFLLAVGVGESLGVFGQPSRYLLSVGIVLSHVAMDDRNATSSGARACFWILCGLGVIFLPEQLVYAAPACVSKVLLDLSLDPDRGARRARLWQLAMDLRLPALLLAVAMVGWWGSGQWAGILSFYASLPIQAVYGAVPTDMANDLRSPSAASFVIAVVPFAFIGVGLFERLTAHRPTQRRAAQVLMGSGLLGWMLLQKHVVRPWGEWQFLTNLVVGALLYGALRVTGDSGFRSAALGIVAGCAFIPLAEPGVLARLAQRFLAAPGHLIDNVRMLASERSLLALDAQRFLPERFPLHSEEQQAVAWVRKAAEGRSFKVYVLGDAPVVYVLLRQDPPWVANDYNASPLSQQKRIVDWLGEQTPEFVVWNAGSSLSDSVPSAIRVPLIYQAVINGYVPVGTSGRFQILRRRAQGQDPDIPYWRERLGTTDLGYLPLASEPSRRPSCQSADCAWYLRVTSPPDWAGGRVPVTLTVQGQRFAVSFETRSGSGVYNIRLDRLWFWLALVGQAGRPSVEWSDVPAALRAELRNTDAGSSSLY